MESTASSPLPAGGFQPTKEQPTSNMDTERIIRHKRRRLKPARGQVKGEGRLIASFREFLATRNVISGSSRRYDKIVNDEIARENQDPVEKIYITNRIKSTSFTCCACYSCTRLLPAARDGTNQKRVGESRVLLLLKALFRRSQRNKCSILITLLRAPIFLAALFSLMLILSIILLYTLSFADHYHFQLHYERRVAASATSGQRTAVQTECGSFIPTEEAGSLASVFRGIPYASPPIGERRWRRPRPIWSSPPETGECLSDGSSAKLMDKARGHCAQISPLNHGRFTGQEDCLYLDIYTPQQANLSAAAKLPVLVYFHGGFLTFGSNGESPEVDWLKSRPSGRLASELNVILVAPNFRLQALGFMTLEDDADNRDNNSSRKRGVEKHQTKGNFGLWDQLVALNWIRRNIEPFGGDSQNIVLFGPDSASALPLALLTNPEEQRASGQQWKRHEDDTSADQWSALIRADLFRGLWLTNPTLYYALPGPIASQHYRRLLFSPEAACFRPPEVGDSGAGSQLQLECLMKLSGERVTRDYLNQDDSSYRLDDQNSLPIRGLYADQFVTLDRELVRDSYPFSDFHLDMRRSRKLDSEAETRISDNSSPSSSAEQSKIQSHYYGLFDTDTDTDSEAAANETGGAKIEANYLANGNDVKHDDDNCASGANCAEQRRKPQERIRPQIGKDLLLGSSAQAVEFWPCPRDLRRWNWTDFERYVETSLNSFFSDTYERAANLYGFERLVSATNSSHLNRQPPANKTERLSAEAEGAAAKSPKEIYLTMASDIRQVCPINQLADSLQSRGHQIHRYIVEHRPSAGRRLAPTGAQRSNLQLAATVQWPDDDLFAPEFAFHTWDLIAFFGFPFEPSPEELALQAEVRRMVAKFVHREDSSWLKKPTDPRETYTLFPREGPLLRRQVAGRYKAAECDMWNKQLGQSYAWVS